MTLTASQTFFTLLICCGIAGAAIAALVLLTMFCLDWRGRRLW